MIWRFWTLTILFSLAVFGGFAMSWGGFDRKVSLTEKGKVFIHATGWAVALAGCPAAAMWPAFH